MVYGRIIYTWIFQPELFTESQLQHLDRIACLPSATLQRMRQQFPSEALQSRCDVFHPGGPCAEFHKQYLRRAFPAALKLFLPIYFISSVATKYQRWMHGPRPSVTHLFVQYLRSSASLTLGFQLPLYLSCLAPSKNHRMIVVVMGMLTYLTNFVEDEKRRVGVMKGVAIYSVSTTAVWMARRLKIPSSTARTIRALFFGIAVVQLTRTPDQLSGLIRTLLYGDERKKENSSEENKL